MMTEFSKEVGVGKWRIKTGGGSRRCCGKVCLGITLFITLLSIIILILALTLFKPKNPKTKVLFITVDGISPRLSGVPPMVELQLNFTLNINASIHNPNHAAFKHGPGKCLMLYRGTQVGQADILPGNIPSMGSNVLYLKLTFEMDKIASNMSLLISDVMSGQIAMDTSTWIAGRVKIIGIKKHIAVTSYCHIVVATPAMKVQSQDCKNHVSL